MEDLSVLDLLNEYIISQVIAAEMLGAGDGWIADWF